MHCLVTAGNTREPIDSVRQWSNIFTGNTGLRIAQALALRGPVDLLTSNAAHSALLKGKQTTPFAISDAGFTSHADLQAKLQAALQSKHYDAVFMTAAVADYLPAGAFAVTHRQLLADGTEQWTVQPAQAAKIKSSYESIAFLGRRSEKLVDLFRKGWGYGGLLVKFKLEVGLSRDELIAVGQASRAASGADYLVANTLNMVEGAAAGAYLIGKNDIEWIDREKLPTRLAALVGELPT